MLSERDRLQLSFVRGWLYGLILLFAGTMESGGSLRRQAELTTTREIKETAQCSGWQCGLVGSSVEWHSGDLCSILRSA